MAPAILSYFGFGTSTPTAEEERSPIKALPASWYTSKDTYDLERRAIFSRRWLLVTHKLRLTQSGEWLRYTVAGFAFILCRDREGKINGFHNVCRHRAYPVVEGADSGISKIFACRYHGWSYGLNGKLAKAPGYQELEGFDKSKNGLFPIHIHVDQNGFIWVNFDAKEKPELAWEDDYEAVDRQERFEDINFDDYQFDHTWEQKGEFNWKLLANNYNESYNSSMTDSDDDLYDPTSSSVESESSHIQQKTIATEDEEAAGLPAASTYHFPNASMNVSPHFFFIQRFEPNSPTSTSMRYEVYRNKSSSEDDFQRINQIHKRIMCEDRIRCKAAQRNIDVVAANMSTDDDEADPPWYFQETFRDEVMRHHKREEKAKREIWPARQELPVSKGAGISQADIEFCEGLACGSETSKKLEW